MQCEMFSGGATIMKFVVGALFLLLSRSNVMSTFQDSPMPFCWLAVQQQNIDNSTCDPSSLLGEVLRSLSQLLCSDAPDYIGEYDSLLEGMSCDFRLSKACNSSCVESQIRKLSKTLTQQIRKVRHASEDRRNSSHNLRIAKAISGLEKQYRRHADELNELKKVSVYIKMLQQQEEIVEFWTRMELLIRNHRPSSLVVREVPPLFSMDKNRTFRNVFVATDDISNATHPSVAKLMETAVRHRSLYLSDYIESEFQELMIRHPTMSLGSVINNRRKRSTSRSPNVVTSALSHKKRQKTLFGLYLNHRDGYTNLIEHVAVAVGFLLAPLRSVFAGLGVLKTSASSDFHRRIAAPLADILEWARGFSCSLIGVSRTSALSRRLQPDYYSPIRWISATMATYFGPDSVGRWIFSLSFHVPHELLTFWARTSDEDLSYSLPTATLFREAVKTANALILEVENILAESKSDFEADYGFDNEMVVYRSQCFKKEHRGKFYEACLYDKAFRGNEMLGTWTFLSNTNYFSCSAQKEKSSRRDRKKAFTRGDHCLDGDSQFLTAQILFVCAKKAELHSVTDHGCSVTFILGVPEICTSCLVENAYRIQRILASL